MKFDQIFNLNKCGISYFSRLRKRKCSFYLFRNSILRRGLHPALIGLVIAIVLGALLFAGVKIGMFSFISSGYDAKAQETLNNSLSSVEKYWLTTGNSEREPDWGWFKMTSDSGGRFISDWVKLPAEAGRLRFAECAIAKNLATDEPELSVGFLEAAVLGASNLPRRGIMGTRWNTLAPGYYYQTTEQTIGAWGTGHGARMAGVTHPITIVWVDATSNCTLGPDLSPNQLGRAGLSVNPLKPTEFDARNALTQVGGVPNTISRIIDAEDLSRVLPDSSHIIIDLHTSQDRQRLWILGMSGANSFDGQINRERFPPGKQIVLIARSASGNTFCIRHVFDKGIGSASEDVGTHYQAISENWTNSWNADTAGLGSSTQKYFNPAAFATCQAMPNSDSAAEAHLGYSKAGFSTPYSG